MADEFDPDEPRRRYPSRARNSRDDSNSGVKVVLIVVGVIAVLAFLLIGGVVALAIYGARQVSKSMTQAMTQLGAQSSYGTVGAALSSYQSEHGHFPPVAMKTKDGSKGLSWRVAILPQLGYPDLYKQFKLDEAWNHPDNLKLASQIPFQYQPLNGSMGTKTHIRVFVRNGAMFEFGKHAVVGKGKAKDEIGVTDPLSDTIMFVEATDPVDWIEPDELEFNANGPIPALGMPGQNHFFLVTADGLMRMQTKPMNPTNLRAAITAHGGETVNWE